MNYNIILNGLKKTVEDNLDTIIFTDKKTEKLVQFAFNYSNGKTSMILDVPFAECTEDEKNKLSKMISNRSYARDGEVAIKYFIGWKKFKKLLN